MTINYLIFLIRNLLHRAWKWGDQTMVETHAALTKIELNQFREFVNEFMTEMKISLIALGNTHMADVKDLVDIAERIEYRALSNQTAACVEKVLRLLSVVKFSPS